MFLFGCPRRQPENNLIIAEKGRFPTKAKRAMKYRDVVFQNAVGLHGRPATYFIQKANGYKSDIRLIKGHDDVNAKSLLGVLHLGISQGTRITLMATGEDEDAALEELAELIENGCGD